MSGISRLTVDTVVFHLKTKSCCKDLSLNIVPRNAKQREENKLISACFVQTYNKEQEQRSGLGYVNTSRVLKYILTF